MMTRPYLHSYLFALFPILFLYSKNVGETRLSELLWPLAVILAVVVLVASLLSLIVQNREKVYLAITVFLILFFSYGQLLAVFAGTDLSMGEGSLLSNKVLLPLWLALSTVVIFLIARTRRSLLRLTTFFNAVALVLVVTQLVVGCYAYTTRQTVTVRETGNSEIVTAAEDLPDIYYIVLDGYGRHDVLREMYEYDNSNFLNSLRSKGFFVVDSSLSNYCATDQSLTATLNLDYLHNLGSFDPNSSDRMPLAELFADNAVCRFLKARGYGIGVFTTGLYLTRLSEADLYFTSGLTLSEFQNSVINMTPVAYLLRFVKSQYDMHRDRIHYVIDKLPQTHELRSPKFVLAHIMAPHPPFVFGPLGQARDRDRAFTFGDGSHYYEQGGNREEYIAGYAGQAAYLSAQVEQLVEEMLRASRKPPIIIIQGDHGPGSGLNWQNAGKTNLQERFSNLNALYLPGCDYSRLSRSMTPVNSFRVILNRYFGTVFEMLPNHNYFTARTRPYLFIEVTDYLALARP